MSPYTVCTVSQKHQRRLSVSLYIRLKYKHRPIDHALYHAVFNEFFICGT